MFNVVFASCVFEQAHLIRAVVLTYANGRCSDRYLKQVASTLAAGKDMYHHMSVLLDTRDTADFERGWGRFRDMFAGKEPAAFSHLASRYYGRKEACALAFRGLHDETTNNVVEVR